MTRSHKLTFFISTCRINISAAPMVVGKCREHLHCHGHVWLGGLGGHKLDKNVMIDIYNSSDVAGCWV